MNEEEIQAIREKLEASGGVQITGLQAAEILALLQHAEVDIEEPLPQEFYDLVEFCRSFLNETEAGRAVVEILDRTDPGRRRES